MGKRVFGLFVLASIVFLMFSSNLGAENMDKISQEVKDKLDKQEQVEVIKQKLIAQEEVEVLVKLGSRNRNVLSVNSVEIEYELNLSILDQYDDWIIANVSKADLFRLEQNTNIESISVSPVFKAMLQDSVEITNASNTWDVQVNGVNVTGTNQTICVLDTGADFSHPALVGKNKTCVIDCVNQQCDVSDYCFSSGDDNGHGTHVAGIIGAFGGINGVAINVSLISVKVLNSAGTGNIADINKGIDWCVNNKDQYNIGVISMSLGTSDLYNQDCDFEYLPFGMTTAINNAYNKNISLIAASGNDGNSTHISSPSCLSNVIAVSATDKSDNIAPYSNYNPLVDFFAPGSSINSTVPSGSCSHCSSTKYKVESGTSASTPHVAAAFTLIRDFYYRTNSRILTPAEIQASLNESGKQISLGEYSRPRIDIYTSVLNLDAISLNVTLSSPLNLTRTNSNSSFICNISTIVNSALDNSTFYLWNSTQDLIYNETKQISGVFNSTIFQYNFTSEESYEWNCQASNNLGNSASANSNFTFIYDVTSPSISINKPLNNTYNNGAFNVTLNEEGNCEYSFDEGGMNYSMNSSDNLEFTGSNLTLVQNESYNLRFYCNDSAGNLNQSSLVNFTADYTLPNITLISPDTGASYSGTTSVNFQYNVTDNLNLTSCGLILNGAVVKTNQSEIYQNETNSLIYSVGVGSYTWGLNCTDIAGNVGNSTTRSLTINVVESSSGSSSGGSSGGGGGGVTASAVSEGETFTPTRQEVSSGYSKQVSKGDKIKFEIFDENAEIHTLSVDGIGDNHINLTIRSDPIKLILGIGQSAKVNLTSSEFYNFFIRLDKIENGKASLTIQSIMETIVGGADNQKEEVSENELKEDIDEGSNLWFFVFIGALLAFVVAIIVHYYDVYKAKHAVDLKVNKDGNKATDSPKLKKKVSKKKRK